MELERENKDFKSLSKVVRLVNLSDLFLQSSNVIRTLDALSYESVEVEMSSTGELLSEQEDSFQAKVSFCLIVRPIEEEKKELVRVDSEYILIYELVATKKPSTDDIKVFCEMNAVYNAWPFWREFVQNMANKMDLPVPIIPLLKFKLRKNSKEKQPHKT